MTREIAFTLAMITAGAMIFLWAGRQRWQHHWHNSISRSILFETAGILLCLPYPTNHLDSALFELSGRHHLNDFFGHLAFICALGSLLFAAMCRVLPGTQVDRRVRRAEWPCAIAAFIMLGSLMLSGRLLSPTSDMLDIEPVDIWLRAYWATLSATLLYLLIYVARLLVVVRTDRRSEFNANLYLLACAFGIIAVVLATCDALFVTKAALRHLLWALLILIWLITLTAAIQARVVQWVRSRSRKPSVKHRRISLKEVIPVPRLRHRDGSQRRSYT